MFDNLDTSFGAVFNGTAIASVLYGVTCGQVVVYYRNFPQDRLSLKWLVAVVLALDTLQQYLNTYTVWFYQIEGKAKGGPLFVLFANWSIIGQVIPTLLIFLIVHLFFFRRIWVMVQKRKSAFLLLIPTMSGCCLGTAYVVICFMFPKFGATAKYTWVLVGSVVSQCTGDIVIAAAMCYVLHDKSRGIPPDHGTRSVVTILFHYTLTTGVLTSCAAAAYLIAYVMSPQTLIYIGIFFAHGKLYTNSLMASLNSRASLRAINGASEEMCFDILCREFTPVPTTHLDSDASNVPHAQR